MGVFLFCFALVLAHVYISHIMLTFYTPQEILLMPTHGKKDLELYLTLTRRSNVIERSVNVRGLYFF